MQDETINHVDQATTDSAGAKSAQADEASGSPGDLSQLRLVPRNTGRELATGEVRFASEEDEANFLRLQNESHPSLGSDWIWKSEPTLSKN